MTEQREDAQLIIRAALERLDSVVARNPEFGASTDRSIVTVSTGLRCSIEEGPWRLEADLSESIGGSGLAPTPGVYGRAALGSCLAMGYQLAAARLNVELTSVRVEIEADSEVAGMLSSSSAARPGYRAVRYHVAIESSAAAADVQAVIDQADRLSPYRDVFASATPLQRTISINRPDD